LKAVQTSAADGDVDMGEQRSGRVRHGNVDRSIGMDGTKVAIVLF
jgi:hypothetical protein